MVGAYQRHSQPIKSPASDEGPFGISATGKSLKHGRDQPTPANGTHGVQEKRMIVMKFMKPRYYLRNDPDVGWNLAFWKWRVAFQVYKGEKSK